jgi:hypothetical protein
MTEATKHGLSKFDLFTPNRLHPTLPPLLVGLYTCMGSYSTMLSTSSVLARKKHIHGLLPAHLANDDVSLRRRVAAHERLITHMEVGYRATPGQGKTYWEETGPPYPGFYDAQERLGKKLPKSMKTREAREAYVKNELAYNWAILGMGDMGASKEEAIEIE